MRIFIKARLARRILNKKEIVEKISENRFRVTVKEPPIKGRANQAIIKALAEYFKISVSRVSIVAGITAKEKIIRII